MAQRTAWVPGVAVACHWLDTVCRMDPRVVGLRAQDVYSGLQVVDQTSGLIAAELDTTRLTGMAATVAANIKGIDLIKDPKVLKVIAAGQWGIDSIALPRVLDVLQEVGYLTLHKDVRGKLVRIDEHIPLLHDDLYERLGSQWLDNGPSELDSAAVQGLERLATAPIRLSEFEGQVGEKATIEHFLEIGNEAQFAQRLRLPDGDDLIWSPFCAYEQPEALSDLFVLFSGEKIREEFERVKGCQGLPITRSKVLREAVGQGILLANAIDGSGGEAAFAFLPYRADPAQRRMEKIVLEKAMILLACVRYGEHYAKHSIRMPAAILRKLRDGQPLSATTEASSQYRTAAQGQIVRLISDGDGGYFRAQLIDTSDNVAAVDLALDLLTHGEPMSSREDPNQKLLFTGGSYLTPLMTMKNKKPRAKLSENAVQSLVDVFRGERGG